MKIPQLNSTKKSLAARYLGLLTNSYISVTAGRVATLLITFMLIAGPAPAQTVTSGDAKTKVENSDLAPEWTSTWTGPFDCAAVNASTATELAHITTDNQLRLDYSPPGITDTVTFTSASGSKPRTLVGIADTANTVTTDNLSSGTSLTWSSTKAIGAVLVGGVDSHGSTQNRIYWMPEGVALGHQFSGSGFTNANGSYITKVAFCYHQPATVTIIKSVTTATNGSASTAAFGFTSTNLGPATFSLVDNNVTGPDRNITANLYAFAKWNQSIAVTENSITNWTLADITCVEQDTVPNQTQYPTTTNFLTRTATIRLEEGESVTCTYSNTQLTPTAAPASVSGRVMNEDGIGIRGVSVTLWDISSGEIRTASTNSFGNYTFADLPTEDFYVLSVSSKRLSFAVDTRSFTLTDDLAGMDFVASP